MNIAELAGTLLVAAFLLFVLERLIERSNCDYRQVYWRQLQSRKWKRKARKIKERDGWRCALCGETRRWLLSVHHPYYVWGTHPADYPEADLMTICRYHHSMIGKVPVFASWEIARKYLAS